MDGRSSKRWFLLASCLLSLAPCVSPQVAVQLGANRLLPLEEVPDSHDLRPLASSENLPRPIGGLTPTGRPCAAVAQDPAAHVDGSTAHTAGQISWKLFVARVLQDQKQIWLYPRSLAQGERWWPAAVVVLATAGLVALDARDVRYFRRTHAFAEFNRALSFNHTVVGMAAVPTTAYLVGWVRRDSYSQQTAELTAEGLVDAGIPALVLRDISRRIPPGSIPPNGEFDDSWFRSHKGPFYLGPGGFPSGHALAAFSIATVFSKRYGRHRWVPWVAYGGAAAVSFSRLTLQAHFPSDVFAGATLGYVVTRHVVLRNR